MARGLPFYKYECNVRQLTKDNEHVGNVLLTGIISVTNLTCLFMGKYLSLSVLHFSNYDGKHKYTKIKSSTKKISTYIFFIY